MQSPSQVSIKVFNHDCGHLANPGFQDPRKAYSYLATQPLIVPKAQIFSAVCEFAQTHLLQKGRAIKILEPGIGPGFFSTFLLRHTKIRMPMDVSILGLDISRAMIDVARQRLEHVTPADWVKSSCVELHSGVDCLKLDEAVNPKNRKFSLIVNSQFEHYFPNSQTSALGQELAKAGLSYLTKRELREFAFRALDSGGIYVTFDDFLADNATQHAINELGWDLSVLRRFCSPAIQRRIVKCVPELKNIIKARYDLALGIKLLLQSIAAVRESRRRLCREETQNLNVARRDLEKIFGRRNVFCRPHPRRDTHANFHLLYAIKR